VVGQIGAARRDVKRPAGPADRFMALLLSAALAATPLLAAAPAAAAPTPLALSGIYLSLEAGALSFSSPYVEAGDTVVVSATVTSAGDLGTNATVEFFVGDPSTEPPFAQVPFSIGANTTSDVAAPLNTSDLVGIEQVTARIVSIAPPEQGPPTDNQAAAPLRVHRSVVDMLWEGASSFVINESYPHTGFITVRENATLTVGPAGDLSVVQRHDSEFDILVEGDGTLRLQAGPSRPLSRSRSSCATAQPSSSRTAGPSRPP
jgi:hypothetical protein